MKKIKASALDPRREALLPLFLLIMFIPVMVIAGLVFLIRLILYPFVRWEE